MTDLRYPIGKFEWTQPDTEEQAAKDRARSIDVLSKTPLQMRSAIQGLNAEQFDTPYRPEGWTVRQVVHHVPDSHMNAYIRFKLALTESMPTIKPYAEAQWAKLEDTRTTPVEVSLSLLDSLHTRWMDLLRSLKTDDFARKLVHPEHGEKNVDWLLFVYAWHGPHHTAHITELRKQKGW